LNFKKSLTDANGRRKRIAVEIIYDHFSKPVDGLLEDETVLATVLFDFFSKIEHDALLLSVPVV
jgi:hypothetical protein